MRKQIKRLLDKSYWWFMHLEIPTPGDPEWDAKHPFFEPMVSLISSVVGVLLTFKIFF